MDFGSSHVYVYDNSDEEYVSDDELQGRMGDSDEDTPSPPPPPPPMTASMFGPQACRFSQPTYGIMTDGFTGRVGGNFSCPATDSQPFVGGQQARATRASDATILANKPKSKKKHHWQTEPGTGNNPDAFGPAAKRILPPRSKTNYHRRADVNVVNVKFDQLIAPSNMHAGDAEKCMCGVVMSHISTVQDRDEKKFWTCEFCSHENEVDIIPEEIPSKPDVTFMLEPAPVTTATSLAGTDESLVVFCVDTSGSMCQTTEVEGDVKLKGADRLRQLQSFNTTHESQYLPSQRRHVTYVSRLQSAQAAMDYQLMQMAKDHPNRRVALVTFNSEVVITGDGSSDPVTVAGDRLRDAEGLADIGKEVHCSKPVTESRDTLSERLWSLEEGGQTALGPAMLIAINIAGQHRGSKVIMCTDGAANIGVGNLDNQNIESIEETVAEQEEFYSEMSRSASEKGVSVSVITIKGTECGMVHLGRVASETGGQVNIVDPLKLTEEFSTILANPVLATNVRATFIVHRRLYIRDGTNENKQKVVKEIGNVTAATVELFEYGVVKNLPQGGATVFSDAVPSAPGTSGTCIQETGAVGEQEATNQPPALAGGDDPKDIPFQIQIEYTDRDGAKVLRVVTQVKPTTRSRQVAEQNMNIDSVITSTKLRSAQLASDGQYGNARKHAMMSQRLVSRVTGMTGDHQKYQMFVKNVSPLENILSREQGRERRQTGGLTLSDDEDEDEAATVVSPRATGRTLFSFREKMQKKSKVPKCKSLRMHSASDEVSTVIHQHKIYAQSQPVVRKEKDKDEEKK